MTNVNPARGGHFVLHIGALHQNPFDGHTLALVLKSFTQQTGITPERIYVDKGYQGHDYEHKHRVFKSGQKTGCERQDKKELKLRSIVEPIIGHLKSDHALGRNFLKGLNGDKINALLADIGYNFRLLLRWLRFFASIWRCAYGRCFSKIANLVFCRFAIGRCCKFKGGVLTGDYLFTSLMVRLFGTIIVS